MVETDPIQIDKIQRKLRHRYMLLVGLNIIAYLTVIAFCIIGSFTATSIFMEGAFECI